MLRTANRVLKKRHAASAGIKRITADGERPLLCAQPHPVTVVAVSRQFH